LQAKAYGRNDGKLKQDLEEARELYFQTHVVTMILVSPKLQTKLTSSNAALSQANIFSAL